MFRPNTDDITTLSNKLQIQTRDLMDAFKFASQTVHKDLKARKFQTSPYISEKYILLKVDPTLGVNVYSTNNSQMTKINLQSGSPNLGYQEYVFDTTGYLLPRSESNELTSFPAFDRVIPDYTSKNLYDTLTLNLPNGIKTKNDTKLELSYLRSSALKSTLEYYFEIFNYEKKEFSMIYQSDLKNTLASQVPHQHIYYLKQLKKVKNYTLYLPQSLKPQPLVAVKNNFLRLIMPLPKTATKLEA